MAQEPQLSSRRPYLLRAMHEWMTDNGHTPHLVIDAGVAGVVVPRQHVRDGKIVLNASYAATADLMLKNDLVTFSARFGGTSFEIRLPINAVLGIYARETGQGMIFSDDAPSPDSPDPAPKPPGGDDARRPQLKIVK